MDPTPSAWDTWLSEEGRQKLELRRRQLGISKSSPGLKPAVPAMPSSYPQFTTNDQLKPAIYKQSVKASTDSPMPDGENNDDSASSVESGELFLPSSSTRQPVQRMFHSEEPARAPSTSPRMAQAALLSTSSPRPQPKSSAVTGHNNISFSGRDIGSFGGKRIPLSLKRKSVTEEQASSAHSSHGQQHKALSESGQSIPLKAKDTPSKSFALREEFSLPTWYQGVPRAGNVKNLDRNGLDRLSDFRKLVRKARDTSSGSARDALFDEIRTKLHILEHMHVDEVIVKQSKLLEPGFGLPRLFAPGAEEFDYPYDIVADSELLFNKWRKRDFNPDILRGIEYGKKGGAGRKSAYIDPKYEHRQEPNTPGENDLVNGQWWPILLAALRDGAHGAAQAGIHGERGLGAFSVLVSGSEYEDKDDGDVLLYCGTKGEDGNLTEHTKLLFDNIRTKQPVRVLRTAKLPQSNPYRPSFGFRYDGLYNVVDSELLSSKMAHHRFRLERRAGQNPIRCEGLYARPSTQDVEAYNNHKGLMK